MAYITTIEPTLATVGYFCFVNRLVLATGLRVEAAFEAACRPELERWVDHGEPPDVR